MLAVSACARHRPARRRAAERVCAAHQLLRLHSEPGVVLVCPAGEPGVEGAGSGRGGEWKGRRTAALMQGYRVTRGNLKYGVIWKVSSHSTKNGANRLIIHHNQAQCTTIPACQNFGRRRWCYRDSGNFIEICSLSHVLKTLLRQNQIFDGILR